LDYIITLGETGLSEMRALIFDLRPEALEAEGLVKALTKRAAAVQARFELQVITDVCCEPDVPLATKEEVYRIAQEMLHNAVRHAFASRLELKLACDEQGLQLALADNGVGFDPSQTFSGHLGLHSMRERARFLGGSLDIDSAPGQGTRVQLRLPRSREVPVR
jgi:signal transduction histidine kinase